MFRTLALSAALLAPAAVFADGHVATGDAEAGEAAFRTCIACHVVRDPEGNVLAGRNGRQGPNLYALPGALAGAVEDFRYSSGMEAANEAGLIWTEENFVAYLPNATAFLREYTSENVRSNMTPQRVDEEGARNLFAFLASLAPALDEMEEEPAAD